MRPQSQFTTIHTEGGLLPPDLLARVAEGDKSLEGLDPIDYHLAPGERLNEAISRSWNRLLGAWENFTVALADAPESDRTATALTRSRWSQVLFQELDYGQLQTTKALTVDGTDYPLSHLWGAVPVHLVGARVDLDRRTSGVAGAARMSPHGLVQDLLNRSDDHLWGFVSNGLLLRLLRDNVSLTRQAYLEFDLEAMMTGQAYADFVVLWLVCHQSRVEGDLPEKCFLERWSAEAARHGTRALDQLRAAVESAIGTLGQGFLAHPANTELRDRLRSGDLDRQDYYRQLLRLIYRLLFVSVAEARDVLNDPAADPTAKERYRRFYSLERIGTLAETRRGGPHGDLWAQLQLVFRALGDDSGCPALALPALGSFLWSADATPDLDHSQLANRHVLAAIRTLSSTRDGNVTRTVDYRNLGSEELGSVYESLLELHPELNIDARTFSLSSAAGNERKTTGSYYTPTSLINCLLDSALDPVLDEAAAQPDPKTAILALRVLDPACGSGHFLIAAAHRIAKRLAAARTGDTEPSPRETRTALRDVIGRCLHGIDINPMAVELCKVSLWMESLEAGKPLSFLEHRIVCGNSLLGTTPTLLSKGIPDEAFKPLDGDDPKIVTELRKRNKLERQGQQTLELTVTRDLVVSIRQAVAEIDAVSDDEIEGVEEKGRRYAALQSSAGLRHARLLADAWCAAFVVEKRQGSLPLTHAALDCLGRNPTAASSDLAALVDNAQQRYRFLHLHLAFPHIFGVCRNGDATGGPGWTGGFDTVLGNPPWERVKLSEKEFFSTRAPEITQLSGAKRKAAITALAETDMALYKVYRAALRDSDGESHILRSSGRYPLCGRGDVNLYAVFAELMLDAVGPKGRLGAVLPTGIATDDTTKQFFAAIVEDGMLRSLYDFNNSAPLFPNVDRTVRFCLLTLVGATDTETKSDYVFGAKEPTDLEDIERHFSLTAEDLRLLNPNTRTCPIFRTRRAAELTKQIYRRIPILLEESALGSNSQSRNPWKIEFSGMFHMTNDSKFFRTADEGGGLSIVKDALPVDSTGTSWMPLYEAKMFHHFDHRYGSYGSRGSDRGYRVLPDATIRQYEDPGYVVQPFYWVPEVEVRDRVPSFWTHEWLFSFRDITRADVERTFIGSVIPLAGVGNSAPVLYSQMGISLQVCLFASLSSFVFDFVSRQKVGRVHMNYFIFQQLPVLEPGSYEHRPPWSSDQTTAEWLRSRILELCYTASDIAAFANDLGYKGPPFAYSEGRRALIRAELDACFFHLYGIAADEVDYVMETFPIVRRKDEARFGEYRTKRLILECYDAMAKAAANHESYQTRLDPPPADPRVAHPPRR